MLVGKKSILGQMTLNRQYRLKSDCSTGSTLFDILSAFVGHSPTLIHQTVSTGWLGGAMVLSKL